MKLIALAGLALLVGACGRSLFLRERPATETRSEVPGNNFKTLATLAATDDRAARRVTANLRADLNKAGVAAVPSSGRWDTEQEAYDDICAQKEKPVDGVLLVSYKDLSLIDCQSRQTVFAVEADPAEGGPGIREMTRRLIGYLNGEPAPVAQN
jgi:hypothetical protein